MANLICSLEKVASVHQGFRNCLASSKSILAFNIYQIKRLIEDFENENFVNHKAILDGILNYSKKF